MSRVSGTEWEFTGSPVISLPVLRGFEPGVLFFRCYFLQSAVNLVVLYSVVALLASNGRHLLLLFLLLLLSILCVFVIVHICKQKYNQRYFPHQNKRRVNWCTQCDLWWNFWFLVIQMNSNMIQERNWLSSTRSCFSSWPAQRLAKKAPNPQFVHPTSDKRASASADTRATFERCFSGILPAAYVFARSGVFRLGIIPASSACSGNVRLLLWMGTTAVELDDGQTHARQFDGFPTRTADLDTKSCSGTFHMTQILDHIWLTICSRNSHAKKACGIIFQFVSPYSYNSAFGSSLPSSILVQSNFLCERRTKCVCATNQEANSEDSDLAREQFPHSKLYGWGKLSPFSWKVQKLSIGACSKEVQFSTITKVVFLIRQCKTCEVQTYITNEPLYLNIWQFLLHFNLCQRINCSTTWENLLQLFFGHFVCDCSEFSLPRERTNS